VPTPATQPSKGQVIFSRSTDENGQTTTKTGQTIAQPAIQTVAAPSAEDAERQAVTFTAFDLDVRLRPADQQIAVRALVTVRNDGKTRCKSPPRSTGSGFASTAPKVKARMQPSRSPRSIPTLTTPASCMRLLSHSSNRSPPAKPSSST
jgi:hypothetical protein